MNDLTTIMFPQSERALSFMKVQGFEPGGLEKVPYYVFDAGITVKEINELWEKDFKEIEDFIVTTIQTKEEEK